MNAVDSPRRPRLLFVVESGTDVRLVDGLARHFDLRILARRIGGAGREISHPPAGAALVTVGPSSRARFAATVARHLLRRGGEHDAVLVQGYGPAALACHAARLAGRGEAPPALMLVCSPVEAYYRCRRENPTPGGPRFWRVELLGLGAFARLNARLGRGYVVLSQHLGETVRAHGAAASSVHEFPLYGVDLDVFSPPPAGADKAALKRARGLPETGQLVFFSSRVAPEKDSGTLLTAFAQRLNQGADLWLLHRSGGWREFARAAEAAGVGARVVATDAVFPGAELAADYRASDLCVQASRAEGLGFSVLEALVCGVPVVATAVGGLRETIRDGDTGWTYPAGDAGALAARLAEALSNPEESQRRAARGRRMVEERFAAARVFPAFADFVQGWLETAGRSPR